MHMQRMVSRAESRCARLALKLVLSSLRAWQRDASGRKTKRRMHARLTRMRARAVCRKMLTMWCNASYARGAVRARASAILIGGPKALMALPSKMQCSSTQRSEACGGRLSMQGNKVAQQPSAALGCPADLGAHRHTPRLRCTVDSRLSVCAVVFKTWVGMSPAKGWLAWWRHRFSDRGSGAAVGVETAR